MTEDSKEVLKQLHRIERRVDNVLSVVIFIVGFFIFDWSFGVALAGYGDRWIAHVVALGASVLVIYALWSVFGLKKPN